MIATEPTIEQMIAAVKAAGYKVTKPVTRKLTPKKIIEAHLSGAHRGAFDEECRVCRFARAVKDHKTHEPITRKPRDVYDEVQLRLIGVNRCPLCVDAATEYSFVSRMTECKEPSTHEKWYHVCQARENIEPHYRFSTPMSAALHSVGLPQSAH